MKKIILLITALFTLMISQAAMAASVPDNFAKENKTAETLINSFSDSTITYASISGDLSAALKEKFTDKEFAALNATVKEKFGRQKEVKFVSLEHFDKADRLVYMGSFSKENLVLITFVFENAGRKPLLTDVSMLPVTVNEDGSLAAKSANK